MIEDERPDAPDEQPAEPDVPGGDAEGADAPDPSASADPSESPTAGDDDAPETEPEADAAPEEADAAPEDAPAPAGGEEPAAGTDAPSADAAAEGEERPARRERPRGKGGDEPSEPDVVPGAHLEPDLVLESDRPEGELDDALSRYATDEEPGAEGETAPTDGDQPAEQPAPRSVLDLSADARYRATGKRKTAVARVILRPGDGAYSVNGRTLEDFFPRVALQKAARQPLEVAGFERRMDVVARIHGGGVSAQAGALRHGVARALVEADPNLRPELKRRGLLTRDARAKERKKAGLKKARKRPQFSKR